MVEDDRLHGSCKLITRVISLRPCSTKRLTEIRKTDADTYHILPNLLEFLQTYDVRQPTFFGSSYGISYTPNAYFQGLGYGFSWGLVSQLQVVVQGKSSTYIPRMTSCALSWTRTYLET
jgi:hypothetical protein